MVLLIRFEVLDARGEPRHRFQNLHVIQRAVQAGG
jgi:hypothetical protein